MNFIKRIDDLGRIVIPKEIRRSLCIQNNENMEISINDDVIVIKKHSLLKDREKDIIKICKTINSISNNNIILTDREKVIYSNINELLNKELSSELKEVIINRKEFNKDIEIVKEYKIESNYISENIIIDSDIVGVIIMFENNLTEKDKILLEIVSKYVNTI